MEKIEVSVGELVDKLSILEIKLENISDSLKKKEVEKEELIIDPLTIKEEDEESSSDSGEDEINKAVSEYLNGKN